MWRAGPRLLQRWLLLRLLARSNLSLGTQQMNSTLVRYVVLVIGFMVVLQTLGIGFGLQNILFSNFISGLIMILERPVKVGDRIEIAGVEGDVVEIGARSTRLLQSPPPQVYLQAVDASGYAFELETWMAGVKPA